MTGITWAEKPYSIKRLDTTNIELTVKVGEGVEAVQVVLKLSDHEARIFAHDILKEAK
jgi:hypothetical protein